MNTPRITLISMLALALAGSPGGIFAQTVEDSAESDAQPQIPLRTPEELDELLGPIALFPDPLIALILPAAANSSDIVLAARFLSAGGDPEQTADQPWAESVHALAHYRDVIDWLDQHLEWTIEIGEAFIAQPVDVMDSIQRLRALARAAGNLQDTPQQRIIEENGKIYIVAAQPDVIYVPVYDPDVVYVCHDGFWTDPCITFGFGFAIGTWLSYDCDWYHYRIWIGDCYRPWTDYRSWRHPRYIVRPGHERDSRWHAWQPPVARVRRPHTRQPDERPPRSIRPTPFPRRERDDPGAIDVRDRGPVTVQGGRASSAGSRLTEDGRDSVTRTTTTGDLPTRGRRSRGTTTPLNQGGSNETASTASTDTPTAAQTTVPAPTYTSDPRLGTAPSALTPSRPTPAAQQPRPTPSGNYRGVAPGTSTPTTRSAVGNTTPAASTPSAPRTVTPAPSSTPTTSRPSTPPASTTRSSTSSSSSSSTTRSSSTTSSSQSSSQSAPSVQPRSSSGSSSSSSASSQPRSSGRPSSPKDD